MKDKNGNLNRAFRKLRRFSDTQEWCACLTPSEMLAVLNDGGTEHSNLMYQKESIVARIARGDSRPRWFYFYPSQEQKKRLKDY